MPVDPRVSAMAAAIAAQHGAGSRAVLFYGSCLREKQLDGLMLDFYLIVSDYRAAYGKSWLAAANRLIPPNVFHFEHDGLAAKYAVLSEADFAPARAGDGQRVGLGTLRAAVAAGLGGGRGGARPRGRRGQPRRADPACGGRPLRGEKRARPLAARLRAHLCAELRAERKGRASIGRRSRSRALPSVHGAAR